MTTPRNRCRRLVSCSALLFLAVAAPAAALPVSFSPENARTVGADARAIAHGNFDGNLDPDLVTVNEADDNISVLRGADGVTFNIIRHDFAVGDAPRAVAVANFNASTDAKPDLAVAISATDEVDVLAGQSAGPLFSAPVSFPAGNGPRGVAVGQFDGVGDPDLAVANEFSDNVSVLLGGSGTSFGPPTNFTAGDAPSAIVTADFNGDADPDLAVANFNSGNVSILPGRAGGTFGPQLRVTTGDDPRAIAVGDFNGDGDPDLAVVNERSDNVSILLGIPGAGFAPATSFAAGDLPRAAVAADFTRDGHLDLAIPNTRDDTVAILIGNGAGGFAPRTTFTTGNGPFALTSADFDADGELDLGVANFLSGDVSLLRNTTAPDTGIASGPTGLTADSTPSFAFTADEPGASFQCRIDGAAFGGCPTPFTAAPLVDGAHTLEARAVDPAGNIDATPVGRFFVTDATAPETTIAGGPGAITADSTPTFEFGANEPAAFQCRVDAGAFAPCTSPLTTAALADGSHTFEARATDAAGNVDATPASRAFASDATRPNTRIRSGPRGRTTDRTPRFSFSSSDPGSTFACRVDKRAFVACSSPFTTSRVRPGKHAFEVRATDRAGNQDPSPARRRFTALLDIAARFDHNWLFDARGTTMVALVASRVPRNAKVQVRCRGGGCPYARRNFKVRKGRVRVQRTFAGRRLRPGALVEVRVTARNAVGKVARFPIVRDDSPDMKVLCLQPGAKRPKRCPR